jgi:hypothetical protein
MVTQALITVNAVTFLSGDGERLAICASQQEDNVFSVDYRTLSRIIRQFMYTGIFRAKLPGAQRQIGEGFIELQAREGTICACFFITAQGYVQKWESWETRLTQLGALDWEQTSSFLSQSSSLQLPAASPAQHSIHAASHTIPLPATELSRWPSFYRRVYSLIDGKRQSSDIAFMLNRSEEEVARVMDDLYQQGLIRF